MTINCRSDFERATGGDSHAADTLFTYLTLLRGGDVTWPIPEKQEEAPLAAVGATAPATKPPTQQQPQPAAPSSSNTPTSSPKASTSRAASEVGGGSSSSAAAAPNIHEIGKRSKEHLDYCVMIFPGRALMIDNRGKALCALCTYR